MYHYTESGLSNIYLVNGYTLEEIDGEEYSSIHDILGLHKAISVSIVDRKRSLSGEEFKFLRIELNLSQKALGDFFGVSEQTIARYEKEQTEIPRPTDAALRALYMESQDTSNPIGYFLELIANAESEKAAEEIKLEEQDDHWAIAA